MSNFTDTELEGAVSRYVRDEVKNERTDLGPLNADYTFKEVTDFASSTLVFDPSAIFYLMSLAANRVKQDVDQALLYLDDIQDAIDEVGSRTTKVTQTSLLEDAATALAAAETILTENDAITSRQFTRYEQSLNRFRDKSLTPNVRRETGLGFPNTYEVVRPPQQAQAAMKTDIPLLSELHTDILEEVSQLDGAFTEFLALDLPNLAVQDSVRNVRSDLRGLKTSFDKATDDGAIELTRDAYLTIEAGKSVVMNLTSISDPSDPRMENDGDQIQAASPAETETAGQVTTSFSAPFAVVPGISDGLTLAVDGGADQAQTLVPEAPAQILGDRDETYDIHLAQVARVGGTVVGPFTIQPSPDNIFDVYVDGVGYRATLTSGSRTLLQVIPEIIAATRIDGQAGTFGSVANAQDDGAGRLELQHLNLGVGDIVIGDRTVNAALGFTNSQDSDDYTATRGVNANNIIRFVVDDVNPVVATLTVGTVRTAAQVAADIASASPLITAGTTTVPILPSGNKTVITVSSTIYGDGSAVLVSPSTQVHEDAMLALGFTDEQKARGAYYSLEDLFDAVDGLTGISAERSRTTVQSGLGGTAVLDGADYKLRLPSGTITSSPVFTDMLVIMAGENSGRYLITNISLGGAFDEFTVSRPFPVVTGDEALNQSWEIRRDSLIVKSDTTDTGSRLEVKADSANAILGLVAGINYGTVSGLKVSEGLKFLSFSRADVKATDIVTIGSSTYTVDSVSDDGYQIEVTPAVPNNLAAASYKIESEGAVAYVAFAANLDAWDTTLQASKYSENILELERRLNPLLVNRNPSAVAVNDAASAASDLQTLYNNLAIVLEDFTTAAVNRIDDLLDMLQERGLDLAHDTLLLAQYATFFSMTKDSASYGGNLLEKMRSIAQNDVPLSRDEDQDHVDSREIGTYDDPDADFDFSDADDERGVDEVDDIPDQDAEDDFFNKSY